MKWKAKPKPKVDDTRKKTRFLFFPKCLDNEWRWLEKATWIQEYTLLYPETAWWDISWLNKSWGNEDASNDKT